jgi:hypothetical protein
VSTGIGLRSPTCINQSNKVHVFHVCCHMPNPANNDELFWHSYSKCDFLYRLPEFHNLLSLQGTKKRLKLYQSQVNHLLNFYFCNLLQFITRKFSKPKVHQSKLVMQFHQDIGQYTGSYCIGDHIPTGLYLVRTVPHLKLKLQVGQKF